MEFEIKFKVKNPENIRKLLEQHGEFKECVVEEDIYFDLPDNSFSSSDKVLRVRFSKKGIFLTYKGSKLKNRFLKIREEIEVKTEESIVAILKAIGFVPKYKLRKKREIYNLENTKVCLDYIEGLGCFIEVEVKNNNYQAAMNKIKEIAKALNFNLKNGIRKSYLELMRGA